MKDIRDPHLKHSFLSENECQRIIWLIQRYAHNSIGLKAFRQTSRRTQIAASSVYQDGFHMEAELLNDIVGRCQEEVERTLLPIKPIFPGFVALQGNYIGDGHIRHADSRRFDIASDQWIQNHTPNWLITCGLYLNRNGVDFTGGELNFPGIGCSVPPQPGLLVAYPSDERFEHEVPIITSGARYSILIWFTDNPAAKGRPILPITKASITAPLSLHKVKEKLDSSPTKSDLHTVHNKQGRLAIVGTGIASISQLTLETMGYIRAADIVFYHANSGVTASYIRELNPNAVDLYAFYGEDKIRTITYVQMAELMLQKVREGASVVGVFHGHPGFFVLAARRSLAIAKSEGYETALIPAVSAIDCLFADLRIDPGVSGMQILKASYVLKKSARLATDNNVVLIQIGSVGDNTFSFSGSKKAQISELFDKLIAIYGKSQDSVYYVAPIFPGFEPVIIVRKLGEYLNDFMPDTIHAATLYIPPVGVSFNSLTMLQAFKGRPVYGQFETDAISALEEYETPKEFKVRGATPAMLDIISKLANDPQKINAFKQHPKEFVQTYPKLTELEKNALVDRDIRKMRAVTTSPPGPQ